MNEEQDFDKFVLKTVNREVKPIDHKTHPKKDTLLDYFTEDLDPEESSKLSAHLATCSSCRDRWRKLSSHLKQEKETMKANTQISSLTDLVKDQQRKESTFSLKDWLSSLIPTVSLKPKVLVPATALITAAITLAVILPFMGGPGINSERITVLTREIEQLQKESQNLTEQVKQLSQGTGIPNSVLIPKEMNQEKLNKLFNQVQGVDNPWQRSLMVASFLTEHGIIVPDRLDWENLRNYTVKDEDTWKSIAEKHLGESKLWPLIYLLNIGADGKSLQGRRPEAGEDILIPSVSSTPND